VGKVTIPYYVVRKGRGYWLASPKMKLLGFNNVRCGPDGADAWKTAELWNERWQRVRKGETLSPSEIDSRNLSHDEIEELALYPEGGAGDTRGLVAGLAFYQAGLCRCRSRHSRAGTSGAMAQGTP
jgi:hypothetical protein